MVTLLISTYNWHKALELVLISVLNQSVSPNEIIIADDGSTNNTKKLINHYRTKTKTIIKHIWHEDKGFRKTIILNKAIAQSENNYIIQIDGDIILHRHFIKDHIKISKQNNFVHGGRVFLNKKLSKKVLLDLNTKFSFLDKGIKNRLNTIYTPFLSRFFLRNTSLKGTRGCNFGFWKKDFIKVNGYNEDIIGWGKEDTELASRLINHGLYKQRMKFSGLTYHLYHETSKKEKLELNTEILNNTINNRVLYCKNGINKHTAGNN